MRIRKLARENAPMTSGRQVHVCEFNQSPWDIQTDFSPPSSPTLLPPSPKMKECAMIESSDASISVMEWEECDDDVTGQEFDCTDSDGGGSSKVGLICCKSDGKKWQCKREAMYGNKLCEHHCALASKLSRDKKKKSAVIVESAPVEDTKGGRKRLQTKKPKAAAADPNEIYYYSGFTHGGGKRRGEDFVTGNNLSAKRFEQETVKESSSTKVMNDVLDYAEDDDDEDEEPGLSNNKRAKKPIKSRSLKSLM